MINLNFNLLLCLFYFSFSPKVVELPICGTDITHLIKAMKMVEGENIICTSENGKTYIAIVQNNEIVDWKITDKQGLAIKTIVDRPLIITKAKPKAKPKPHADVLPEKITVCEEVKGKPANCITYTRVGH
jgi:hypothetical protein